MGAIYGANGSIIEQWDDAVPPISTATVDAEAERRIEAGFHFGGKTFQARDKDLVRMSGGALNATIAIMAGAQSGNLRWANPDEDFGWIAYDNSILTMDAQTMVAFGQAAAGFNSRLTFIGRDLKNRILAGEVIADITDDAHWS